MRISKYFKLGRDQATLDFVDVDYNKDTRLFLSPRAIANLPSEWGDECTHLIQSFFKTVLQHIQSGNHSQAEALLNMLREPNETHLGLSRGKSRGRALGESSAHDVWRALSYSKAAQSGLITDLEDTVLLIDGVGIDIISDITTNIIRGPLISYTQEMARQYGMKLTSGVITGPVWHSESRSWIEGFEELPMTPTGKLLLVPKAIVRQYLAYSVDDYYRNYLSKHLQRVELAAGSALVEIVKKTKERRVSKEAIKKKYGNKKEDVVRETLAYPSVFQRYKDAKDQLPFSPLEHERIAAAEGIPKPDWDALLSSVISIKPGTDQAPQFEGAIEALTTALFYPALTNPRTQSKIHGGLKRIDITYTNMGAEGFFRWLSLHRPASTIAVECKNYSSDISNPELDQMIGRLSQGRGRVGVIACRAFQDKARFIKRCVATANDGNGFILVVDDGELKRLTEFRKNASDYMSWPSLRKQFNHLINAD